LPKKNNRTHHRSDNLRLASVGKTYTNLKLLGGYTVFKCNEIKVWQGLCFEITSVDDPGVSGDRMPAVPRTLPGVGDFDRSYWEVENASNPDCR
jgi:hypothetical protein